MVTQQIDGAWRRGFHERLRELGWVEGRTIEIHERFAEGRLDRPPEFERELVALRVEVIKTGDAARITTSSKK